MTIRVFEAPEGHVLKDGEVDGFADDPDLFPDALPTSVRYVKLGRGGAWWAASRDRGQLHAGWREVPAELLLSPDRDRIRSVLAGVKGERRGLTQDVNALMELIDRPSRHVWITFEAGKMWWCRVRDGVTVNPAGPGTLEGNFHLDCCRPWSDRSLGGRLLTMSGLPGGVTATAGYQATVCEPAAAERILRIIRDEAPTSVTESEQARASYELAVGRLIKDLDPRDFEVLIDLILTRSGWRRISILGGTVEGVDLEVEQEATREKAFVQVKSRADRRILNDYVGIYRGRRDVYDRMIFAVHEETGELEAPSGDVHLWTRPRIAELVVRQGLVEWLERRVR